MRQTTTHTGGPVYSIVDLQAYINARWKDALEAEGFGRVNTVANAAELDVTDELTWILYAQKLQSFYDCSKFDRDNRARFLAEYAAPYYTTDTLKYSILPQASFVRTVIDSVAMLYKDTPERGVGEDGSAEAELYSMLCKEAGVNRSAKRWHRMLHLHNTVAVRPVVRDRYGKAVFMHDVIPPSGFRALFDSAGNLERICIAGETVLEGKLQNVIYCWTDAEHYMRDATGKQYPIGDNVDMVNPYERVPYYVMRLDRDAELYAGGAEDLVELNLYANYVQLLENTDLTFSAINIINATNVGLGSSPVISPRDIIAQDDVRTGDGMPAPPTLEIISGTPHADVFRAAIDAIERQAKTRAGLPSSLVDGQAREWSGAALKQLYRSLLEKRADDADVMADNEAELYEMTAHVLNTDRAMGVYPMSMDLPTDAAAFHIDFAEIDFEDDPQKSYDLMMQQVDDGVRSIVTVYRSINSDITGEDEILAEIEKNKWQVQRFKRAGLKSSLLGALDAAKESVNPDTLKTAIGA